MKKVLSLFLGFLILFSVLVIETGTVRAEGQNYLIVKTTVMTDLGNINGTVSKTYRLPSEASATTHTIEYRTEGTTIWFYLPVTSKYDVLYYLMRDAYYNKEYYKLYIEDIITNTLGTSLVSYDAFYHDLSGIGDIEGTAIYIRAYCPGTSSADSDTQEDTITLSSSSEIAVLLDDWFQRTDEARNNVQAKLDYGNDGTFEYDTGVYTSTQAKGLQFVTGTDATLYTYLHADDRGGDYEAAAVAASIFVLSDASVSNTNTNAVIVSFNVQSFSNIVTFYLKDALSGQSLTGVTVKENGTILGYVDDGGSLELQKGTHTLTLEKQGYWSTSITIDVQSDMNVSVELYPDSAAFIFKNFPSDIQVYENSIYELTFTLSPIDTSATYNTYLSLSGLSDVLEVRKNGQLISPESGKYSLGDVSGDTQVSIKFKAESVGTHSFTITVTSNDAIMSNSYTTTKQVVYDVIPLPFSVQMPSEWTVGTNEVRVSESSGQPMVITAVLKDSQGNEVWSDSYAFNSYEAYTFKVNVPSEGEYTLEFQFLSTVASFDIQVNPSITLLTKSITAKKGEVASVQLKIRNPSSETKYYTVLLEGAIIEGNVTKTLAIAPLSEKTVDVAFQVPKNLEYDAYDLTVKILEGDAILFQDTVHLVIDTSGFSLVGFGGGNSWLYVLGGLLIVGLVVFALKRR